MELIRGTLLSLTEPHPEPPIPPMQLNPLQIVTQFAHVLQQELFPELESSVGPLSEELKLLAAVVSMAPLDRDRGKPRGSSPPTPPDMRVRIRRFGGLSNYRTVNLGI